MNTNLPKILVVDDNPNNIVALRDILEDLSIEVISATCGNEALSLSMQHDFALTLLDVRMPEMDGIEVATLLSQVEQTRQVPIIFLTAADKDAESIFKGYQVGAVDYLYKPVTPEILISKVKVFLELYLQKNILQKTAEELDSAKKEALRSNNALHDFAHAAAHDLKAPVRHIQSFASILLKKEASSLSDEGQETLNFIVSSAQRMHALIQSLLEFSELDAKPPVMETVELSTILNDIVSDFKQTITETDAILKMSALPAVLGNNTLLHQLFQNLISNALKYRKPAIPPEIEISYETDTAKKMYHISFADNGIGFDQERSNKIFEPFRRLVTINEYEGSGIGMATAKKIVELHNGAIKAQGQEGQGATFTVSLPIEDQH